ncbi:hypothetical protein [Gaoshiqia sp. Z1-71]|uniref:hypothetical protein n=1 Tax=Gaoshiqia hydrogeniformans TaxID=3290090 RepID=UPI003BF92320
MKKSRVFVSLFCLLMVKTVFCSEKQRWGIIPGGAITWDVHGDTPHYDHLEMSGECLSVVLRYGVKEDGSFRFERSVVWPMLRTIPNDTHASLNRRLAIDFLSLITFDGISLKTEEVKSFTIDGSLYVVSDYSLNYSEWTERIQPHPAIRVTRTFFPSVDKPVFCEQYRIKNITDRTIRVAVPAHRTVYQTAAPDGVYGAYTIVAKINQPGSFQVGPNEEILFDASIQAFAERKGEKELSPEMTEEKALRDQFVHNIQGSLVLETPDPTINHEFAFSKVRIAESLFRTAGGLMHCPGGEAYYAAIWANDESEYAAPFFPYLGYDKGNEATLNTFRLYMKYMNADYVRVPSSIIAEGTDIWQAAGDCGDAAMLVYGGARYALTRGDKKDARYIWPLLEWCLEYCNRNLNEEGVVKSDADELEGRFPSGNANILVSSLYYDGLVSSVYLAKELKLPQNQVVKYEMQAKALRKSIELYFGANVEGFETYAYYQGNDVLRSWICAPVFAGIEDRAKETIHALFSRLWTKDGLLSQSGSDIFWDRSTLSGLRAAYVGGETEKATKYLSEYSIQRLLGDHVPYPIEAWPEGNQRHLSGESGLYCRIIIEGMFGIRPVGFRTFTLTPRLPESWDHMALKHIKGFASDFDVVVDRLNEKISVTIKIGEKVIQQKNIEKGETITVKL